MHSSSTHTRIPLKSVNSFPFVCFSQVRKLLSSVKRWLKKYTLNRCFLPYKKHTAAALSNLCYSSRGVFVSVVSAFRVHFLTFIGNYPISQRASTARTSFPLFPCAWSTVRGVRFRCFRSFPVSAGKVITLKPINQTILEKSLVKKSFAVNTRRFCA